MCLSSFFQFPFFLIACVEELETVNSTSSKPQEMLSAGTMRLPSLLLLLSCFFLVLGIVAPEAIASPISSAEAHHRHTRPWLAWRLTSHVRRDTSVPITTGAELPDIPITDDGYWAGSNNPPSFAMETVPRSAIAISSSLRLPRDLFARTHECWKAAKLLSCVMHVLKADHGPKSIEVTYESDRPKLLLLERQTKLLS